MTKKYFITGVMGFVGSYWAEDLLKNGHKVVGMDISDKYTKLNEYENFSFYKQSIINNKDILEKHIKETDYVLHLASIAEPAQYMTDPKKVITIAALASIDIIDLCVKYNKKIFFTSTSEIYGKNNKIPFKEDDDRILGSTTKKRWCYSTSKALVEHYLQASALNTNLDYRIVRLFNVYGPRLEGRVVSYFVKNALENKPLEINGTGRQTRCFTFIDDVIEAFNLILKEPKCKNEIFNVGSDHEISIEDFAKKIISIIDSRSELIKVSYEKQFGNSYEDIERRVPDLRKIKKYINWNAKTSLEKGISFMKK